MNFDELRKKHGEFIYKGFQISHENEQLKISFDFLITPDIKFHPFIIFPDISKQRFDDIGQKVLNNLAFNLGMVELISYWKAACATKIIIKAGFLDEEQIKFWKKLLIKGLGEFFYNNEIDFTKKDLVKFKVESKQQFSKYSGKLKDRDLVLVGGGKDSAVTLESISKEGKEGRNFNCLLLNPTKAAISVAEAGGCKNPIIIKRTIDPKLLELNKEGYLNGHTPFSAYLAFMSVFAGILYDYKNLVVSNEASSNEGNVVWLGQEINHQYSKTEEFEKDFKDYSSKYLASSANYYSFLRLMGELQISGLFSKMEKYHKIFRSCNRGAKEGIWCGECPKCVSTYLLLYPFLGQKTDEIFGKDLTKGKDFIEIVKGLLRENDRLKPFECVATVDEIKTVIKQNPKVLSLLNHSKILILGFGREGKSVLNYYKKYYPEMKVGIADKNDGENYLDKIKNFDVIIKSPGIPYLPEIKKAKEQGKIISSATKIFFDNFKGKIIGVTGTKGKSTTASLIYEVLKAGGFDVYLVGNIGRPALDLLDDLNENSIVVFELSSFQLEDLEKSPNIAVMTNIYPEHFDHHGDFSSYLASKEKIAKYQSEKDYIIYNDDFLELREIAEKSKAQKIPFSECEIEEIINEEGVPLIGKFNLSNLKAAILIAKKIFKIADENIKEAIMNFKSLPHRLEFIGEFKGIKFYNDSLATIPQATAGALEALGDDVETLIAGGFDRGIDYSVLGKAIAKSKIKNLILFPDTGEKILQAVKDKIKNLKLEIKNFEVASMEEAVEIAFRETKSGKVALLSPASSSFNLFKDYADRGEQFKENIIKLGASS